MFFAEMQMWLYPYCEDFLGGFKFYLASNDEHSDYIKKIKSTAWS